MDCPRCGSDQHWVKEGKAFYCTCPIKDSWQNRCFYHPNKQEMRILKEERAQQIRLRKYEEIAKARDPQGKYCDQRHVQEALRKQSNYWSEKLGLPREKVKDTLLEKGKDYFRKKRFYQQVLA